MIFYILASFLLVLLTVGLGLSASKRGLVLERLDVAREYTTRGIYSKALECLRLAAASGDSRAQFELGLLLLGAPDPWKAPEEAYGWLRKAGDLELPQAQFVLGGLHWHGEGIEEGSRQVVSSRRAQRICQAAESHWTEPGGPPGQFRQVRRVPEHGPNDCGL